MIIDSKMKSYFSRWPWPGESRGHRITGDRGIRVGVAVTCLAMSILFFHVHNAHAQKLLAAADQGGPMVAVAFSPAGNLVASASQDHNLYLWNAATGALVRTFESHNDRVFAVDFSPDGTRLVSAGFDGKVIVWAVESGEAIRTWRAEPWPLAIAFSPDGNHVVAGEADGGVRLLSLATGDARSIEPVQRGVATIAYSPVGDRIAGAFGTIMIRDVSTGSVIDTLEGHAGLIFSVAFTPDGERLISASTDATIRIWNLASGETIRTLTSDWPQPFIAISPDGGRLAAGSPDHKVYLWTLASDSPEPEVVGHHGKTVTGVAFSPDGNRLVSCSLDGSVKIWRIRD